jgi:hypothetical protein
MPHVVALPSLLQFVGRLAHGGALFGLATAALLLPARATAADAVITPREVIKLFNGQDLAGFYTWLPKFGHVDPDRVFSVVDQIDGAPAIRISGQHWGGLVTKNNYANYKLVLEFRWGGITWKPRENRARDSGILIHGQGEDGNYTKALNSPWLRSLEFQIIEGGTGDILVLNGYNRGADEPISPKLTAQVRPALPKGTYIWDPAAPAEEVLKGRINWQYRDPEWKDVLGFRGPRDVEKPVGQWNLIEAVVDGGNLSCFLNGVKVNEGRASAFTSGRLLFQSEAAEIFFRRIELHPLAR